MTTKLAVEADRFDVYVPPILTLVVALVFEAFLLGAIYFFWTGVKNYSFLTVLGFFFLAIASGFWPMIANIRSGKKSPIWSASRVGLEFPARTTTWTKMRPPIVYEWSRIKKFMVVGKLTFQSSDGNAKASDALVVIFNELQSEHESAQQSLFQKLVDKAAGSKRHRILACPKKFKPDVLKKLRELAPHSIRIEEVATYDLV